MNFGMTGDTLYKKKERKKPSSKLKFFRLQTLWRTDGQIERSDYKDFSR